MATETTDLVVVNAQNAVEIFTRGGMNSILEGIEGRVRAMVLDASTPKGRDEIRSVAYKVARTKTALDAEAKKLTEGWREATAKVNAERKRAQERLENLAEEVRKPLTDFENKEKNRIAAHEAAIAEITGIVEMLRKYTDMPAEVIKCHGRDLLQLHANREWEEFGERARRIRREALEMIASRLDARQKFEADQAELERLRKEEAARLVREREERIKAEAAEKARIEAESRAKAAADAEAKRVIEAARKEAARVQAETDRVRAENERAQREAEAARQREEEARKLAEKRANEAEAARLEAIRRAELAQKAAKEKTAEELRLAKEKAKRDAEAAITREREKVESERAAIEDARLKREADELHRARIREEIGEDLNRYAESETGIIDAIMTGKIRHVRVIF